MGKTIVGLSGNALITEGNAVPVAEVPPLSFWSITDDPVAGVRATATKAGGAANERHVLTHITVTLVSNQTAVPNRRLVSIRDGASDSGTELWLARLSVRPLDGDKGIISINMNILGSLATAMTVEFVSTAPSANIFETVSAYGFTIQV